MEQILNSNNMHLLKGQNVSLSIGKYNADYPIIIDISSSLFGTITGSCGENVNNIIFPTSNYEIPVKTFNKTFTYTLSNKCAKISATLTCSITGEQLNCTFDYDYQGQSFIQNSVSGAIEITKIYQNIPSYTLSYPACPSGYTYTITRTSSNILASSEIVSTPSSRGSVTIYDGDCISMSASANFGYNAPSFGLGTVGITNLTNIKGNVDVIMNSTGHITYPIVLQPDNGITISLKKFLYDPHPSTNCDGGCYCYCKDGSSVPDGEDCPAIYGNYYGNTIAFGEGFYVETNIPYGKFLDYVKIGNSTYNSTFFYVTANSNTITNGQMVITAKLQSPQWRVVNSQIITFNGSTQNITATVYGIKTGRQTRITVSSGYYSSEYYAQGGVEPEYCDGGCYCYCADGVVVEDGGTCGSWITDYENISAGLHTSNVTGTSIPLNMVSANHYISNTTVTVSENQLTFNGLKSGNSPYKHLVITKVEQLY